MFLHEQALCCPPPPVPVLLMLWWSQGCSEGYQRCLWAAAAARYTRGWQGEHPLFDAVVEAATGRKRQRAESCCSSYPCQVLRLSSSGSLLCLFCFTCCLKLTLSLVHTDTAGVDVLHKGCHHLRGSVEFLLPIEEKTNEPCRLDV